MKIRQEVLDFIEIKGPEKFSDVVLVRQVGTITPSDQLWLIKVLMNIKMPPDTNMAS